VFLVLILVAGAQVCGCHCTPGVIGSQAVALRPQETSMWCWAASGEMCMDFLGADVTQCDEANQRFGRSDCCNSPVPEDCINGGWPEFDKYNYTYSTTSDAALTWSQVQDQVYCKKKPFAFSWHWDGGGGHMMVVIGYVTVDGVQYVTINDPWSPNVGDQRVITYEDYVDGSGYWHWNDYYDITYKGVP
jgi:hypothetical protein